MLVARYARECGYGARAIARSYMALRPYAVMCGPRFSIRVAIMCLHNAPYGARAECLRGSRPFPSPPLPLPPKRARVG